MRRHHVVTAGLLAIALLMLAGVLYIRLADVHLQPVLSGSMRPAIQPGDLAVTQGVPLGSLNAGDVIAFYPPGSTEAVLHRIVTIGAPGSDRAITSKGDANDVVDPWTARLIGPTAYRLVLVVPLIGWLTQVRALVFVAAGLVLFAVVLLELRKVRKEGRKDRLAQAR